MTPSKPNTDTDTVNGADTDTVIHNEVGALAARLAPPGSRSSPVPAFEGELELAEPVGVRVTAKPWSVVHCSPMMGRLGEFASIIGEFSTKAEAEAFICGLYYAWPERVQRGDFTIDGPEEGLSVPLLSPTIEEQATIKASGDAVTAALEAKLDDAAALEMLSVPASLVKQGDRFSAALRTVSETHEVIPIHHRVDSIILRLSLAWEEMEAQSSADIPIRMLIRTDPAFRLMIHELAHLTDIFEFESTPDAYRAALLACEVGARS